LTTRTPQEIHIQGDLHDDISASGNVTIGGSVRGSTVRSGGNVKIRGHVGDGARISARGNISIDGCLEGGQIRAGGKLAMGSDIQARTINGGEALAVYGLALRGDVGPSTTDSTTVGLLADPQTEARLEKSAEGLGFVENEMVRILRTLGLQTVANSDIEELFRTTPHNKRRFLIELLKQLHQLTRLREQLVGKRNDQQRRATQHLAGIDLQVLGSVLAGVQVRLGDAVHEVTDILRHPVFRLSDNVVHWHLDTTNVAGEA
jgi:uncharacterized protein (DUF342 family)